MEQSKNNKAAGLIGTLTFHALLFLLFWLIVFKTPIPPFPEEGGSGYEVNFGTSETGSGDVQPMVDAGNNSSIDKTDKVETPSETKASSASAERVITDETNTDETTEVPSGKSETKSDSKSVAKVDETPKAEERKADSRFLFPPKKKGSAATANEGTTAGNGDQGSLDGSRNTMYHGPGGNGGEGTGLGKGKGIDNGVGPGISFKLDGRKSSSLPIPKASFSEEGRVVVEIKVDQNGVVVSAKPGVKGSTTTNPQLMEIARKAALTASFNTNHDAPDVQKGTIIYNFFLK